MSNYKRDLLDDFENPRHKKFMKKRKEEIVELLIKSENRISNLVSELSREQTLNKDQLIEFVKIALNRDKKVEEWVKINQ